MPKLTKTKTGAAKSARRREELRRTLPRPTFDFMAVLQRPEVINATLILIVFLVVTSLVVVWSRQQVKVDQAQVMTATKLTRLGYEIEDTEATQEARDEARKSSARVYRVNDTYLDRLQAALLGLPKAVAGKTSLEEISKDLQAEFDLTESDLRLLQTVIVKDEPASDWTRAVKKLIAEQLVRNPLLKSQEYQVFITAAKMALLLPNGEMLNLTHRDAVEIRNDAAALPDQHIRDLVAGAGFQQSLISVVLKRLTWDPQPTAVYSEEESDKLARANVDAIKPMTIKHQEGDVLYKRGEVLSAEQYGEVKQESANYLAAPEKAAERRQLQLGTLGLIAIVTLFLGSFATIAYPRIIRNPLRMAAICALMTGMVAVTVTITSYSPVLLLPAALGPTLVVSIILLVAYDQRLSLLLSGIQCMLVTLALEQSVAFFILLIAGCAAAIVQLREVRHRNSLIRAATGTAAVLGTGTILLGLLEVPPVEGAREQVLIMALAAVVISYGVGFLVLGILPSIERVFDITTGMTLAELRDPKQPLLRQLQQRAPGTYNHSLQVANIAEAAADAIGADGLLVYVGALYHDVGKINKPDYFVENQAGGQNKHDKLSPAMSLLVIIGHVKNGIELAREYSLPRPIIHFIESHHGTTLVEYFYHAAQARAENEDQSPVEEVEYRYPGPKPRTKEAAILMLSDAVESATRSMAEPTPSRIEALVRKLSTLRLHDNQFDQCDLTFRELSLIEDAIINRLMAIYHSRISYPSGGRSSDQPEAPRSSQIKPISA